MIYSAVRATLKRVLSRHLKLSKKKNKMSDRCHNCRQNNNLEMRNSVERVPNIKDLNNNASKCSACLTASAKTTLKVPNGSDIFRQALAETENMEHNNNRLTASEGRPVSPRSGLRKRLNDFKESSKNDFLGKISEIKDKFCESKKTEKHKRTVRWADEKKGVKLATVHVLRPRLVFANQVSTNSKSSTIMPRSILRVC